YYWSLQAHADWQAFWHVGVLATGWAAPNDPTVLPAGLVLPQWLVGLSAGVALAVLLTSLGLVVGLLAFRPTSLSRLTRLRLAGLLLWLGIPIAATIRHSFDLQAHYYLALYPAVFLVIGFAAAWLGSAHGALVNPLRVLGAVCVAFVVAVQGSTVPRSLAYLSEPNTREPCYAPTLLSVEGKAGEVAIMGEAAGAERASVEIAAQDAWPMAYLLRASFPLVDLAGAGNVGLGQPLPRAHRHRHAAPVLTRHKALDVAYENGARALQIAYTERTQADQNVNLALTWQVAAERPSKRPLVWQIALLDEGGRPRLRHNGLDHVIETHQGQRIVSWFTLDPEQDPPQVLDPGRYTLRLGLLDTWSAHNVRMAAPPSPDEDSLTVGAIAVAPLQRCAGVRA
ncbi:MAG: hypothetical protein M3336_14125, partial [Chloroflexota bacterium]|nr:hypothetical protein [Chloroflexota bacterium]